MTRTPFSYRLRVPNPADPTRAGSSPAPVWREPSLALGLLVGVLLTSSALVLLGRVNYDVSWLLVGAQRWLAGAALYGADFTDVNPPMSVYGQLPAALVWHLGLAGPVVATKLQTLAGLAVGVGVCAWVLAIEPGPEAEASTTRRLWLAAVSAALGLLPAMALGGEALAFGQREHTVLILSLPYTLLASRRRSEARVPTGVASAVGAMMGLACATKPHYLLVLAGLEIALRLRPRHRLAPHPELLVALLVLALYGASLPLVTPDYLERALPLALDAYWAYQVPILARLDATTIVLGLLAGGAFVWTPRQSVARDVAAMLLIAAGASYLAALAGGTSWTYHRLPARAFAFLCVCAPLIARIGAPSRARRRSPFLAAIGGAAVALVVAVSPTEAGRVLRSLGAPDPTSLNLLVQDMTRAHARGGFAAVLTTSVPPGFPAIVYADADWSLRISCLWPLPAIVRARAADSPDRGRIDAETTRRLEAFLRDSLREDLERRPPDILFIHAEGPLQGLLGRPFDLMAFLLRDPGFARFLRGYEPLGRVGPLIAFVPAES